MPYLTRHRTYVNKRGRQSRYLHEVVPKRVTLRSNLLPFFGRKQTDNRTAFREVFILPQERTWTPPLRALLSLKIKKDQLSPKNFAKIMMKAMQMAIAEKWDPNKLHIVQHSSGWDSRMISVALRRMRKARGDKWFGKTIFLEIGGESKSFRQVMRAEGWLADQVFVYREGTPPREHYAECLEFEDAWRKLNGYCAYPMNLNWDPFVWLQREGVIENPARTQIITGYGANEIGNWVKHRGGFRPYLKFIYYHTLSHYSLWGGEENWIHPFLHLRYISTWVKYSLDQPGDYRKLVIQYIAPKIAKIKPTPKLAKRSAGYGRVSKRLMEQCKADYLSSWIGREIYPKVGMSNVLNYHPWWGYWSLASFCEHLRREGVEVRV